MTPDQETRDRVRALVREVLATATTEGETQETSRSEAKPMESNASPPLVDLRPVAPSEMENHDVDFTRDESAKTIITETDVRNLEPGVRLRISEGARLTSLAEDIVRERNIELVRRAPRRATLTGRGKTIAIGADHGGFEMKNELHRLLAQSGFQVRDFGTHSTEAVDYPDIAHSVASAVASREADLGIIIDGAGVGSAMTANKITGIRAAACYSVAVARNSREHNDANVLTLGSKTITNDEMREIVEAWLTTEIGEERHRKRVAKIEAVERQYRC
jgi:ribose 5-phosphate isomerase B